MSHSSNVGTGQQSPVLGWREWVSLPDWSVPHMKAKVDTGARTSSLHAFGLEHFERDGDTWARFDVHPWQRSAADDMTVEAKVIEQREIKSSSGDAETRSVVSAVVGIAGVATTIELTLARRDQMGFRMLLGRQAIRGRFLVDPGRSYIGGRPPRAVRQRNRSADQ